MRIDHTFKKSRKFPHRFQIDANYEQIQDIIDWFKDRSEIYGVDYIYYYMKGRRNPWWIFSYIYFLDQDLSIEFKMRWA